MGLEPDPEYAPVRLPLTGGSTEWLGDRLELPRKAATSSPNSVEGGSSIGCNFYSNGQEWSWLELYL